MKAVKDKRPVNLDIGTIVLPITAYVSILHRISGVILYVGVGILLWMLDASLTSEESFASLKEHLNNPLCQLLVWAVLAALAYHFAAGVRHLLMDMGHGETLEGGKQGAKATLIVAVVLIVLAGVWVW